MYSFVCLLLFAIQILYFIRMLCQHSCENIIRLCVSRTVIFLRSVSADNLEFELFFIRLGLGYIAQNAHIYPYPRYIFA